MKVQDCIFYQLTKASRAGSGFWAGKVKHLGVTASQAMVLNFLGEENCVPSHTLCSKLQITSATMTGILDRLENLELVERQRHPEDRRAILVCLTAQGLNHAREINQIMVEANKEFLGQMGSKQSQQFKALLKHVLVEGA